tara:strand:- start:138270 stop:138749 length:480 start_codon:yes stop_codon:yes gene_type:complete
MNREEINSHINLVTPNLIRFAKSVTPNRNEAIDLISDALSVYLIKSADDLLILEGGLAGRDASFLRKEILHSILKEIYKLGLKNTEQYQHSIQDHGAFKSFYALDLRMRTYLFLENKMGFSQKDLQKFFGLKTHELTEIKFNAKKLILKDYQDVREVYQ